MKLLFSVLLAPLFLDVSGCNQGTSQDCIDPSKIDSNAVCTMDYRPVCGCDGKTYPNACMAEHSGVTKWEEGACPESE